MFKQLTIFRFTTGGDMPLRDDLDAMLAGRGFAACGPTQELSSGFVAPRGIEHGQLVESVGGQCILAVAIETKAVPGTVLRERADEACQRVEDETGRKPGKKERRQITDEMRLALLPTAFPKKVHIPVWIDAQRGFLVVGSASPARTDAVVSLLVAAVPGLVVQWVSTESSPQRAMTQWLLAKTPDEWPGALCVERECVLKSAGGDGATVKFANCDLANDEVRKRVHAGMLPAALGLSWNGQVSFVLTDSLTFKKLRFLDGVMDVHDERDGHRDRFDADVALATGLLGPLLDDVVAALSGLVVGGGDGSR